MDNLVTIIKIQQILEDLKRMYFNKLPLHIEVLIYPHKRIYFFDCCTERLTKGKFQYKLLTLSSKCNLETDLQPILYNIYKMNLDVETHKYKLSRHDFLHTVVITLKQFQFWNCHLFQKNVHGYASSHLWLTIQNKNFIHI